VLNWAKSIVPKQDSHDISIQTPQVLAKIPVTATEYAQQRDFVDGSESASQVEEKQISKWTTEVGETTRTILENVISIFIPELSLKEDALVFVEPLYEKLTDGFAEGLTEEIVEGIDPRQSIAQIHDAVRKELQSSAGCNIEAAIEQKNFPDGTFKDHLTQLVKRAAKAQRLAAKSERETRSERPEIHTHPI
jgi:hypothetical protein